MSSVFLSSYRNNRECLEEHEKAVEARADRNEFLVLQNFHSHFFNSIETWYMFSIS